MTQNFIGINGLVTQDLNEIRADLTNKLQSIYGTDINIEQNSPDGQWIGIASQEKKDILDLFTQYYNNLDVDRVIGIPQQILYKLNGLIIKAYTYSYVYVDVTATESVTLQGLDDNIENANGVGYTVVDNNGNRWILAETVNLSAGTTTLNFRSAELGGVTALANTIKTMETIVVGVSGVNNPANNYITGGIGESSSEFRTRRNQAMNIASQGFNESIEGQLLNLTNVTQVKVYDNRTNAEVSGIPAHGVWVIVEGGLSEEIGRIIYNNVPPGIPMKGDNSVEITKSNGDIETVYYDEPSASTLYLKATIKNLTSYSLDVAFIKQQIAEQKFNIGEAAESAKLTTLIKDIVGDTGSPYTVEVSDDGTNWEEYITPTGLDEYWSLAVDNITLTVV